MQSSGFMWYPRTKKTAPSVWAFSLNSDRLKTMRCCSIETSRAYIVCVVPVSCLFRRKSVRVSRGVWGGGVCLCSKDCRYGDRGTFWWCERRNCRQHWLLRHVILLGSHLCLHSTCVHHRRTYWTAAYKGLPRRAQEISLGFLYIVHRETPFGCTSTMATPHYRH